MDMDATTPDWLLPVTTTIPDDPDPDKPRYVLTALTKKQYEIAFETIVDKIAEGASLSVALGDYHTPISPVRFRSWIHKDENLLRRFREAQAIGAEQMEDQIIRIADALENPLEDVQRSKLKIDNRWRLMEVYNKERYGKDKSASANGETQVVINIESVKSPYEVSGETIDG